MSKDRSTKPGAPPLDPKKWGSGASGPVTRMRASHDGSRAEPWPSSFVMIENPAWNRLVRRAELVARRAAHAAGGAGTVVLSSDRAVKRLNSRHRRRNKPTNVLTFEPMQGFVGGDIVVALETVRREAQAAGRPASHHLAHLVVHGALHLRGHDHHAAGDARRMEMAEARILHRLGIPNPWKRR
jgi:probable rRNA maturation factor